jgi:butyrate kinase
MSYKILVINPGSTSTKIGVFEDNHLVFDKTLRHSAEEIGQYATIADQKDFRKELVLDALKENNFDVNSLDAVCARGGLLRPIPGGTYNVTTAVLVDLIKGVQGQHASNLGGLLAREIAEDIGAKAFFVDPPVVDEMWPVARYSGHPIMERKSKFHALNQKAVAKRYAKEVGKKYDELNLVVCHMGGGVSVGAHMHGKVVDTENALDGEGPFSPERAGSMPTDGIIDLCFSGKYTQSEIRKMFVGRGGLVAYTGSTDMRDLLKAAAEGDEKVQEVIDAFHYQIAKEIGAMSAAMSGKVDQIILTGGIAYGKETVEALTNMVSWIAPVTVYPGEDELLALAEGALRVLTGEEVAKKY